LAAALDVPCVSLYGPTLPGLVGAYGQGQVHLCAPGPNAGLGNRYVDCFASLPAEQVLRALKPLLSAMQQTDIGSAEHAVATKDAY
jgi:heptosyltransferase-1